MFISHVNIAIPSFDSLRVKDLENPYGIELSKNRELGWVTKPLTRADYIARTDLFLMYRNQEEIAFKWLLKLKWHFQDKELRTKASKELRPRGEMLLALLDLCINLHPWLSDRYKNYAELFAECKRDMDRQVVLHCYNCDAQSLGSKKADTAKERQIIDHLKCGENPYDAELMPAMSALFDVAITYGYHDRAMPKAPFSVQWHAYLKSYKSWVETLDIFGKSTFVFNACLYEQIGKGKQKTRVILKPIP